MAYRFGLAAYIVRSFDFHFSLVHFSGLKYILAHQILHFSPLNAPQCPTKLVLFSLSEGFRAVNQQLKVFCGLCLLFKLYIIFLKSSTQYLLQEHVNLAFRIGLN